jgi:hypothetical protein
MMNQNPPKLLQLYLILIGSLILAIPGVYGGVFAFAFAFSSLTASEINRTGNSAETYNLFLPIPVIIGFFLLGGYIWTSVRKRFVKWFWLTSMIFNLLATLISGLFILKMIEKTVKFDNLSDDILRLSFLLFPFWTIFVMAASAKYAFYKPIDKDLNLP